MSEHRTPPATGETQGTGGRVRQEETGREGGGGGGGGGGGRGGHYRLHLIFAESLSASVRRTVAMRATERADGADRTPRTADLDHDRDALPIVDLCLRMTVAQLTRDNLRMNVRVDVLYWMDECLLLVHCKHKK